MIIATSQKISKRFQKHPSCTGSLKLQPCVQASVLPSKTLSNLETFHIYSFSPPCHFKGRIAGKIGETKSSLVF